jgi:hypothetical protein
LRLKVPSRSEYSRKSAQSKIGGAFAPVRGNTQRKPHLGGVCSTGSLVYVYRAFSISITGVTLPSGRRNGSGLPVYLSELGSMFLKSPSGQRDDCGRAIGILRETNSRWVEFEETTTLLNASSKGWGRRPWPVTYFGDRPRDTQAVPLDLRSQRVQIPASFVHGF